MLDLVLELELISFWMLPFLFYFTQSCLLDVFVVSILLFLFLLLALQ